MKPQKDSSYPEDWYKAAAKNWKRLERMLREEEIEAVAFFLQQSLEKYLKAFLIQNGWRLSRIHDLDVLLDEAVRFKPRLIEFMDLCERVSGYYFTERYPILGVDDLLLEDIEADIKEARRLIDAIKH